MPKKNESCENEILPGQVILMKRTLLQQLVEEREQLKKFMRAWFYNIIYSCLMLAASVVMIISAESNSVGGMIISLFAIFVCSGVSLFFGGSTAYYAYKLMGNNGKR